MDTTAEQRSLQTKADALEAEIIKAKEVLSARRTELAGIRHCLRALSGARRPKGELRTRTTDLILALWKDDSKLEGEVLRDKVQKKLPNATGIHLCWKAALQDAKRRQESA